MLGTNNENNQYVYFPMNHSTLSLKYTNFSPSLSNEANKKYDSGGGASQGGPLLVIIGANHRMRYKTSTTDSKTN